MVSTYLVIILVLVCSFVCFAAGYWAGTIGAINAYLKRRSDTDRSEHRDYMAKIRTNIDEAERKIRRSVSGAPRGWGRKE